MQPTEVPMILERQGKHWGQCHNAAFYKMKIAHVSVLKAETYGFYLQSKLGYKGSTKVHISERVGSASPRAADWQIVGLFLSARESANSTTFKESRFAPSVV